MLFFCLASNFQLILCIYILLGFTEKEIDNFTLTVRGNLIDSMMILVLAMDTLGIVFEKNVSFNNVTKYARTTD